MSNLAVAYRKQRMWVEAEQILKQALAICPNTATYHFNLAVVYRSWEKPDQAIPEYREALRIQPGMPEALYDLGLMLQQIGRNDEALATLRQYLQANEQRDPTSARIVRDAIRAIESGH